MWNNGNSLSVDEAAAILGVSTATVRRRCASGELTARKVGRSWVVDGDSMPRLVNRTRPRRSGTVLSAVDLPTAFAHVRDHDLRRDAWVPDILLHEDDLAEPDSVIDAAALRIEGDTVHDPAVVIPVPKSPFFLRNAVNLSLADRVAYQGVVASLAESIETQLSDSVFSARLSGAGPGLLKHGLTSWHEWRYAVIAALGDGDRYMISTDVTAYFDFIKHDVLLVQLQDLGVDNRMIEVLRRMLKAWSPASNTGIPQGPDASRVLGTFYMAGVDHVMDRLDGVDYFRYMDDVRIVGRSRAGVIHALQVFDQECRRIGLALSAKKTDLYSGESAVAVLIDSELDALQYASRASDDDGDEVRAKLARLFKKAVKVDGSVDTRRARFSLSRLFRMRDKAVLRRVLDLMENLAPLGELVPKYLHPWMTRPSTERRITEFLQNPERNTSLYLSTWLLAGMLDFPESVPSEWVDYARSIALDPVEPTFHRAVALNVLALGMRSRDLDSVREVVRREYDPEIVRAALVGLRRVGRLSRDVANQAGRLPSLEPTVAHLQGVSTLPSLVFRSRRNRII